MQQQRTISDSTDSPRQLNGPDADARRQDFWPLPPRIHVNKSIPATPAAPECLSRRNPFPPTPPMA